MEAVEAPARPSTVIFPSASPCFPRARRANLPVHRLSGLGGCNCQRLQTQDARHDGYDRAAKNLFGVVPGTLKPEYHFRHSDPRDFAEMILDLDDYVRPALHICDAVVGMEGNGPSSGTPRAIGAVLAARNPHALDLACAHIIGIRPEDVPTLAAAQGRGYIPARAEDLEVAANCLRCPAFSW